VFEFILSSVSEKGLPPTIREIGEEFKISSTNGVRYYLGVLEKAGCIKRTGKISRGIEVRREWVDSLRGESRGLVAASARVTGGTASKLAGSWTSKWAPMRLLEPVEIPIVGRVAAGAPILAEENIEDVIAVDKSIAGSGRMFALRVRGDSMKESGLLDGDLAIVRQQHHADSGDIVVALLGDEATVKRFVRREGRPGSDRGSEVILKPENKEYKPIVVRAGTQFSLIGKVVGSIRKY
jgi:repressor LexA